MKIGFITVDRAEQSSHRQKTRILREYPELLILEIPPYNEDLFVNQIPKDIVKRCEENKADVAVMDSIRRISPEPSELIDACSYISNNDLTIEFIDEPWLNSDIWYSEDLPDETIRIHERVVQITYDWIATTDQQYSEARKKAGITAEMRGHRYGPKKGSKFTETPEKLTKMEMILSSSPTFVETDMTEKETEEKLGIPHATYNRYIKKLKEKYPEKVRKK